MQKESRGWGGGQGVDVNQELKLFETEKKLRWGGDINQESKLF